MIRWKNWVGTAFSSTGGEGLVKQDFTAGMASR
jgi:hypothetical protein